MKLKMESVIVTNQNEVRFEQTNQYQLNLDGYVVFPMDEPILIKKGKNGDSTGRAKVISLQWNSGKTTVVYELLKLHSVN